MGVVVMYDCDSWQNTEDAAHVEPRSS